MSASLKGFTPALAKMLGTSPAALYERQRALVRAGLLDQSEGRGPGSGVRATHAAIALLLISVLAAEGLTGSEERAGALAEAQPVGHMSCPITRCRTFLGALSLILAMPHRASNVREIAISRTADRAIIRYLDPSDGYTAREVEFAGKRPLEPAVSVLATIGHPLLLDLAKDVEAMVLETFNGPETTP